MISDIFQTYYQMTLFGQLRYAESFKWFARGTCYGGLVFGLSEWEKKKRIIKNWWDPSQNNLCA